MRVIVLGAGLLGVTSAYYLQQLGHEVTVIDRQATPAAETSFANGGQIYVSHAEPWANPSAPLKVLQWLGKEDAPLDEKSPLWTDIRIVGSDGKPAKELPLKDGYFEMALPRAFFEDNPKAITVKWIDFYRN